jgi:nitrite reductase/ring-hydroxylating ferredoxin subunit
MAKMNLGRTDEFEEGMIRGFRVDGADVAVVKRGDDFFAFRNLCTHSAYSFDRLCLNQDGSLTCVGHFAVFDVKTGEALTGPTSAPLPVYRVAVEDGSVFVDTEV